jgi:hypothetical protein
VRATGAHGVVAGGGRLSLQGALIEDTAIAGVLADGVEVELAGSVVRAVRDPLDAQAAGRGVEVAGGSLSLAGCALEDNAGVGLALFAAGGTIGPVVVRGNLRGMQLQDVPAVSRTAASASASTTGRPASSSRTASCSTPP